MDAYLRKVVYYIDDGNTLNVITGGGRPEKVSILDTNMRRFI